MAKSDFKILIGADISESTKLLKQDIISIEKVLQKTNVDGQGVAVCLGAAPTAVLNVQVEIVNVKKVV